MRRRMRVKIARTQALIALTTEVGFAENMPAHVLLKQETNPSLEPTVTALVSEAGPVVIVATQAAAHTRDDSSDVSGVAAVRLRAHRGVVLGANVREKHAEHHCEELVLLTDEQLSRRCNKSWHFRFDGQPDTAVHKRTR